MSQWKQSSCGEADQHRFYDTAGILSKDLQKCKDFAAEWLSSDALQRDPMVRSYSGLSALLIRLQTFTSIIWPVDFWKVIDAKQAVIARDFAKHMQYALRVKYEEVSFENVWLKTPPIESNGQSLSDFINEVCSTNPKCLRLSTDI